MSPRFLCVIPVVERFSSELLRATLNYWTESHLEFCQMKLPQQKQPTALRHWLFPYESTTADIKLDSKWPQIRQALQMWGLGKLQVHGLYTHRLVQKKVLSIHWTIRDLTCGALEILLVVIRLGVTAPKRPGSYASWDFFFFLSPKLPLFFTNYLQFATLTHRNNESVFTIYIYREVPFSFLFYFQGSINLDTLYNLVFCMYILC